MRVFVAGATGAVGRRLVPMLVARGHQVTGTTTSEQSRDAIDGPIGHARLPWRETSSGWS
jgi:nucleoside-diphosphate-sugar epimerase